MLTLSYPAKARKGRDGFWLVTFRDVPEAGTDDRIKAKALIAAEDALSAALAGYLKDGRELPTPTEPRAGEVVIHAGPTLAAKAVLHRLMARDRLSIAELGRRLKMDKTEVRRLLDPDHRSKLDRLDLALRSFRHRVVVNVEPVDPREIRA